MKAIKDIAHKHGAAIWTRTNNHGVCVVRCVFETEVSLLSFMMEMIGNPAAKGLSSKAIGTTILVWKR